ncbi:MAG: Fe-S-containing protein [Actinomycetota bacterium]|nr:Fe-S-containing protein [Actinomycetota bacterium]
MATTETNIERLQEKKDKFMQKKAKLSSTSLLIILLIGTMVVGGFFLSRSGSSDTRQVKPPKQVPRIAVSDPVDYTQARVDMKRISYKTEGDSVVLSLADIKKNKFVRFEFHSLKINVRQRNFAGKPVLPVLALIVPSGKLMVGVSYCEPCRSTTFHTESDGSLTCNICGTKWDLESLLAWSGACMPFPPDEIKVAVKGNKVLIPKGYLESWKPRKQL